MRNSVPISSIASFVILLVGTSSAIGSENCVYLNPPQRLQPCEALWSASGHDLARAFDVREEFELYPCDHWTQLVGQMIELPAMDTERVVTVCLPEEGLGRLVIEQEDRSGRSNVWTTATDTCDLPRDLTRLLANAFYSQLRVLEDPGPQLVKCDGETTNSDPLDQFSVNPTPAPDVRRVGCVDGVTFVFRAWMVDSGWACGTSDLCGADPNGFPRQMEQLGVDLAEYCSSPPEKKSELAETIGTKAEALATEERPKESIPWP